MMKRLRAEETLSPHAVILRTMEAKSSVEDTVAEIIEAKKKLWHGAMKDAIARQKLRQNIAAFETKKFPDFVAAMKSAYQGLQAEQKEELKRKSELSECDVLVAATYLDSVAGTDT